MFPRQPGSDLEQRTDTAQAAGLDAMNDTASANTGTAPTQPQPDALTSTQMFKVPRAALESAQRAKRKKAKPLHRAVSHLQRDEADADAALAAQRIPLRLFLNALAQLFYRVGCQTEYTFVRLWRTLCIIGHALCASGKAAVHLLGVPLWQLLCTIGNDLIAPWRSLCRGWVGLRKTVQEEREAGGAAGRAGAAHIKRGLLANRAVVASALRYLLPVGACLVFVFTVSQVLSYDYALAVEYKGETIGYIKNEGVWESAQNLVRERIVAADEEEDLWTADPVFSITPVSTNACVGVSQLADRLIATSSDEIQNATGVRVNGTLLGVATNGRELQQALDDTLAPYQQPDNPNHRVEFVQSIELIPGVYYTSSIIDTNALINTMRSIDGLLQVKTIDLVEYEETVPYTIQEVESDEYYKGVRRTIQAGQNGLQLVQAEVTSIDGVEVLRQPLSATTLEEMVPQVVAVGTKERTYTASAGSVGSGVLGFPVPDYSYITTQYGQGGHRGTDICAPYGTPIYAADGGTVVEAGYHSSWGNYVKIDHGNGMSTLYAHCSALYVSAGQTVTRGQAIAAVGSTGNSSGSHCHLELYINGVLTNPMNYVSG